MNMPALFTRESTLPNCLTASPTTCSPAPGLEISLAIVRMPGSLNGLIDLEVATTRYSRSLNPRTRPAPIPCEAPVTITTLLFTSCSDGLNDPLADGICRLQYHVGHGLWLREHDCV